MYTHNNSIYTFNYITTDKQLNTHFNIVKHLLGDTDTTWYKDKMRVGIDQGLAFEVLKNGEYAGHVYTRLEDDKFYGTSVYLVNNPVVAILGFKKISEQTDKNKIRFALHSKEQLLDFVSILTGPSIRRYHAFGSTVEILREDIVPKIDKMYKYLGVHECQQ